MIVKVHKETGVVSWMLHREKLRSAIVQEFLMVFCKNS